jgi:hypothetical protein
VHFAVSDPWLEPVALMPAEPHIRSPLQSG